MSLVPKRQSWWLLLLLAGAGFALCDPSRAEESSRRVRGAEKSKDESQPEAKLPAWKDVEKTIKRGLAKTKSYKPGDLITQDDATEAIRGLKTLGWEVKSPTKLTERLLPASDEMVRLLRGKRGTNFMRKIGGVPGGYDRLDKLRKMPNGRRRMRELVYEPGGDKLIEYMATTPGGKNMGRQLSTRGRKNFNAPTNRIYSENDLLAALKPIHADETKESTPRRRLR